MVKKAQHKFPDPKVTSSNYLFYLTVLNPKLFNFDWYKAEKSSKSSHKKKQEWEKVGSFCCFKKKDFNNKSIVEIVSYFLLID